VLIEVLPPKSCGLDTGGPAAFDDFLEFGCRDSEVLSDDVVELAVFARGRHRDSTDLE